MHARRIRPDTGPLDRRRLAAAGLSAILPGLGQLFNGRRRLGLLFLIPSLILLAVGVLLARSQSPARLAAFVVEPGVLGTLLTINLLLMVWRLVAAGQAFLDTRWAGPTGRLGIGGLIVILVFVAIPHLVIYRYGTALADTFASVFVTEVRGATPASATEPALDGRVNVLLIGVDATSGHDAILTDTMMVASLDPVGRTVSLVSIPRDLVNVPLGDGDTFGPKLNSLMSYADTHRDAFPKGGHRALEDAIGALLGIDIPYYAQVDFRGFRRMVDAVGGIDVVVQQAVDDPSYGVDGYHIEPGPHHLDGAAALEYVRSRKGKTDSDFTRAGRQQQVLVALRSAATRDGSLFWRLPDLLAAVARTIRTDVPVGRLPQLAAIADEVGNDGLVRAVIRHPLVKSKNTQYGSSLVPDLKGIAAMASKLFPAPGERPIPWPAADPSVTPDPSPED